MPLKLETVEEPRLNLTPMIDIVFLLIIFFMVGTRFTQMERQYDLELPTVADELPLTSLPDELVINVRRDGAIFLGSTRKSLSELEDELVRARENFPDQAVLIRGEGQGPYQHVIDVLAVCRRAGIRNVSLPVRQVSEVRP